MIYVGSAESEEHDQILDTIYVGPVPEGRHMFVFEVKFPCCNFMFSIVLFNNTKYFYIKLVNKNTC